MQGSSEGADANTRQSLTVKDILLESERYVKAFDLPRLARPADMTAHEYSIPSNVGALRSAELGSLQLMLMGWYTYLLDQIGQEEADLEAMETAYDIAVGNAMHVIKVENDRAGGKQIPQASLKAIAIRRDPVLSESTRVLIRKRHTVKRILTQGTIYHEQLKRLSREQSRRDTEARIA